MRKLVLVLAAAVIVGIATVMAFGSGDPEPPTTLPTPDTQPAPAIDAAANYASHTVVREFPMDRVTLMEWMRPSGFQSEDPNGFGRIVLAMEPTDAITPPVEATYFTGQWPEAGAVRRIGFPDGHVALERVLTNDLPASFTYQTWGYTTKAGRNIDYVLGEQIFDELPDGTTRMTWTYSLKPTQGWKRRFVQGFVDSDVGPFLEQAMDVVVADALGNFGLGASAGTVGE